MSHEKTILSSILVDYESASEIIDNVNPEWFLHRPNRILFDVCRKLYTSGMGLAIGDIVQELKLEDQEFNWLPFVAEMMGVPISVNHERTISLLLNDYVSRTAALMCSEASISVAKLNDPFKVIADLRRELESLENNSNDTFTDALKLTTGTYDRIEERVNNESAKGLPLGFKSFDSLTNITGQMYIVISARPSMGKTALMLTIARTQLNRDHKVGMFSLEMPMGKLDQRWIQMDTGINTVKMNQYQGLTEKEMRRVEESCQMRSDWNLMIDDKTKDINAIERKCRKMKKMGAEIIFIDQLSKIRGAKGSEYERFSEYSGRIFDLTKELDMPIVLLAQLRRPVDGTVVKKPTLSNLKGTGSLEEDPDIVCFIHRPEYYAQTDEEKRELDGNAYIDFAKHRDGPVYEDTRIQFVKSHGMFADGNY